MTGYYEDARVHLANETEGEAERQGSLLIAILPTCIHGRTNEDCLIKFVNWQRKEGKRGRDCTQ